VTIQERQTLKTFILASLKLWSTIKAADRERAELRAAGKQPDPPDAFQALMTTITDPEVMTAITEVMAATPAPASAPTTTAPSIGQPGWGGFANGASGA
jgi:hypothetical protein